jgi:large subunit ribosomal protein L21
VLVKKNFFNNTTILRNVKLIFLNNCSLQASKELVIPKHIAYITKIVYNSETMSFAVIQTGGKQYKVAVGDEIAVEKLTGDYKVGDKVTLDTVILKDDGSTTVLGAPFIKGSTVSATITESGRLAKILIVRYRQKSRYHKKNGHRQPFMSLKIDSII